MPQDTGFSLGDEAIPLIPEKFDDKI